MIEAKLTVEQVQAIDSLIREHGAGNMEIAIRRNKSSITVGFRIWYGEDARYYTHSAFHLPFEEESTLPALSTQIERHLNACIDDPERAE